jgi:hypothetical protein
MEMYKYAVLGYAPHPEDDAAFPLVVASIPSSAGLDWALFVSQGWAQAVDLSHRCYIEEVLREWTHGMRHSCRSTFLRLTELSVGPIRTLATGECDEQGLHNLRQVMLSSCPLRIG